MKLAEMVLNVAARKVALTLQQAFVDLPGFESKLVATQDSVKLMVNGAPEEEIKKQWGAKFQDAIDAKRTFTGAPHVIEVYIGTPLTLAGSMIQVNGVQTFTAGHGIYLCRRKVPPDQSEVLNSTRTIVAFMLGLSQASIDAFVKEYISNWGQ